MPFAAALSTLAETPRALEEVAAAALEQLPGAPHLAALFYSPDHLPNVPELAAAARRRLGADCLIGCPGEAVVANAREVEQGPALSLWLARWSKPVKQTPFHLAYEPTPEGFSLMGWPDALAEARPERSAILLLGDPFTFPTDAFLNEINDAHAGLRVVGGMGSGVRGPGQCRMVLGDRMINQGAVGVLLEGDLPVRSVVSQGCRPIGQHMLVTRAHENVIDELGGRPALAALRDLVQTLPPEDRELLRHGLHIGRVINEYRGDFRRGDFLVRNVLQIDRESGSLTITDRVRVGQTVQFHVRDAASADQDLHELLQIDLSAHEAPPAGALVFTCNGRGTRLFDTPDHDASVIHHEAGPVPLAGFFAMGELGPVGGMNFIHGYTASVVLFED